MTAAAASVNFNRECCDSFAVTITILILRIINAEAPAPSAPALVGHNRHTHHRKKAF